MVKQIKFGIKKEQRVAQSLRSYGAKVVRSAGSRGAADLKAKFPSGTRWNIQVKATRSGTPASPSPKDLGRLKQSARMDNATAVVAKVSPKKIEYESARGRKLAPPRK